ncbi:MAG: hypothetical protein GX646_04830 [Bacteroidales bacterium]|nr:hypothetical protein [Bacteroidales bacterium]
MKKLITTAILSLLIASAAVAGRQDYPEEYLGLPGDNLNLYAVMKLFQESETLEAFERSLNDENSRINNLDLNNDGYVDYITVSDYVNGEDHTIVLRSVLDRNESQDVAVFTVEKLRNGEVMIQLIGDEALYGRNYIVEPIYAETPNPGYRGRTVYRDNVTVVTTTYYEVAAWPVIRFIYSPRYVIWRSNWYWGYYPVYYRPWRPFFWHAYYGYHYHWYPHYYSCYRHWHQPRWNHYHDYYYRGVRAYSPNVSHRITAGTYKQTYSRPETRRDGEALYASTRSRSVGSQQSAVSSDRRSAATTGSRTNGSQAASQGTETRRATSTTVKSSSQPSTTRSQATVQRSQSSSTRSQSTVQRSSQPPASKSQATVQRAPSRQSVSQRSSSTVSRSSSAPAARSQSRSTSGRSSATVSRSSGSSNRSSATVSRSSGTSNRSSATVSRSSGSKSRSSGTPSRSSSKSSSSSGRSDNSSRSSRR